MIRPVHKALAAIVIAAFLVHGQGKVNVRVTTATYRGKYSPKNSAIIWIQNHNSE